MQTYKSDKIILTTAAKTTFPTIFWGIFDMKLLYYKLNLYKLLF